MRIYLDYAATTPVDPLVKKAMEPYFCQKFGNPSSLHFFGQETMAAVDESREKIAKNIGANFREIIFTGSATEANNLALRGIVKFFSSPQAVALQNRLSIRSGGEWQPALSAKNSPLKWRNQAFSPPRASSERSAFDRKILPLRIIVSSIEHESILETARDLENEGVEIIYLPVNREGVVDLKKLKESLNERTVLVSIIYANNEIGTVQPISEIAKILQQFKKERNLASKKSVSEPERAWFERSERPRARVKGRASGWMSEIPSFCEEKLSEIYPLLHTDAVQAFQYLDCDVDKLGVDLMTLSAHKIYGQKGIGVLYARALTSNPYTLNSIITGGGQEFGLRSGTENVAAIVGFTKAIELVSNSRELENKRVGQLADYFWKQVKKIYPKAELNGPAMRKTRIHANAAKNENSRWLPNILSIYFPGKSAEDLLIKLDLAGIAVSSGSACSTRSSKPSHVLKSCGLSENRIKSSLRFSLGRFTAKIEIDETIKRLKKIISN